ncbi:MAG: allophanate hydrolase subunit 1 [Gemmataceae bacterium]
MTVTPLGDRALIVAMPDEGAAFRLAETIRQTRPEWLEDVVPAYATVGVFFESNLIDTVSVTRWVQSLPRGGTASKSIAGKTISIPVCYELGPDLGRVAESLGRAQDDVITLHTGTVYTVFAIGFVPGFPYLGYLPRELSGVPRLDSPRIRVEPGSVGLTGRQTGIYPSARPGGWSLIGRTPLTIVDLNSGYFPIRVGDKVKFERIDHAEFQRLFGERIPATS